MNNTLIDYHVLRAEGGVGLSILEIMSVHPSSSSGLNSFAPGIGEGDARLLPRVRTHGMKLFQQLRHGGHPTPPVDGSPPWSASGINSPRLGVVPRAMIDEIVASFARRCPVSVAWSGWHRSSRRSCIACNQGCVGDLLGPQGKMGLMLGPALENITREGK